MYLQAFSFYQINAPTAVLILLITFGFGLVSTTLWLKLNREQAIKKRVDDARNRHDERVAEQNRRPVPDRIKMGVFEWLCETNESNDWDYDSDPNRLTDGPDALLTIGIATAETSNSVDDWLAGFWYCAVSMELTDDNCIQDLLIALSGIGTSSVEGVYTNHKARTIEIYFRKATPEEIESFTAANQAA